MHNERREHYLLFHFLASFRTLYMVVTTEVASTRILTSSFSIKPEIQLASSLRTHHAHAGAGQCSRHTKGQGVKAGGRQPAAGKHRRHPGVGGQGGQGG